VRQAVVGFSLKDFKMSQIVKNWSQWLKNSRFSYMSEEQKEETLRWLFSVRDKILEKAKLDNCETLLDIGTGTGLLAFKAYEILQGKGKVIASDVAVDCLEECQKIAQECQISEGMEFLRTSAENINLPDENVDVVVMRSVLVHILNKPSAINEFYRVLKKGGRISLFEPIITSNTRYYEIVEALEITAEITDFEGFKNAEIKIMTDINDPLTNYDENSLIRDFEQAGFKNIEPDLNNVSSTYTVKKEMIEPWFSTPPSPGSLSMKERFLKHIEADKFEKQIEELGKYLDGKSINVKSNVLYLSAEK
jgi:arsenite methyltransferase